MNFKYYSPARAFDSAQDWKLNPENSVDLTTALSQPLKIAVLPVFYNESHDFAYDARLQQLDLSLFDLVLLSDIEYRSQSSIQQWANKNKIKKYLVALGGLHRDEILDTSCSVYRPWWSYNLLRCNEYQCTDDQNKKFLFDALLGARRQHRDFAMFNFQKNKLLEKSIVTYRDFFQGGITDDYHTVKIKEKFLELDLKWPYVSENLDPNWEVCDNLSYSISPYVPWKIYQQTYFSIVCETLGVGDTFFLSEKTTKPLFAKRLFLIYSTPRFLANLRSLGFETFGSVVDESYDEIMYPLQRFEKVSEQVVELCQQNPQHIYQKIQPVLEHNYQTLINLQNQTQSRMQELLLNTIQNLG
jgi:hypothetical protein